MKKITIVFFVFFSLQLPRVHGDESPKCPTPADSMDPLDSKNSKSIEALEAQVRNSACNVDRVFSKINDPKFTVNHNKVRCSEIEMCMVNNTNKEAAEDANELMKENLPRAILLGVLNLEIKSKLKYNVLLKRYEESHHQKVCPNEKVESSCEKDIRNALTSVSGSFIGYPALDRQPLSSESTEGYFSKKFISGNLFKNMTYSKEELLTSCSKKINFTKICNLRDARLKAISDCEKNPESNGCLNQEQNALASLLNSQKNRPAVFLAMEKQLCTSTRLVLDSPAKAVVKPSPLVALKVKSVQLGVSDNNLIRAKRDVNGHPFVAEGTKDTKGPDDSVVIRAESLPVVTATGDNSKDEIKSFDSRDTSSLSESFSNSMKESMDTVNNTIPTINTNANTNMTGNMNSEFSSNINAINEEENKKKAEEKELNIANEDKAISSADKKKQEELLAVTKQINALKAKLEEMNQNVEDLKIKRDLANADKDKMEKDSLEREKSILDLKKKLAELEADKKKMQTDSIAKAQEDEQTRSRANAANAVDNARVTSFGNRSASEQADTVKRSAENGVAGNNQTAANLAEGRIPASVTSAPSGLSGDTGFVLHSEGVQATPESTVVYMTDMEVQKYPFHLNKNATSSEIENMIVGNNGVSIILGNSEEIIPIVLNGVVQLDANGHSKYKRLKISLVKNDKEKKQNIAREISSIADLKHEDQKKRELIRYQEMKSVIKNATE